MSREMVLVPLAEWKRLKEGQATPPAQTQVHPQSAVTEIVQENEKPTKSKAVVVDLLPKTYRARANIILHYIEPYINSENHVVFSDGSQGAHVIDYLRYVLNSLPTHAPVQSEKFLDLLNSSNVPESVYQRHQSTARSVKWMTFE
jgi:hypothetical protein